jgi:hypothetical protein
MFMAEIIDELQKSQVSDFFIATTSDSNGHQCQIHVWHALAIKNKFPHCIWSWSMGATSRVVICSASDSESDKC